MPLFNPILQPEVQQFILAHEKDDVSKLLLKGGHVADVPMQEVVEQIVSRMKAKEKIPFLLESDQVVFPPKISMEQCSSEITAQYKAQLVQGNSGADLTGGAGIDSYFFSKRFEQFDYVEQFDKLAQLTAHNFEALGATTIKAHNTTAEEFLESHPQHLDFIYLDPARRDEHQKKVFLFAECTPNIVELKNELLARCATVMVKASPLVDVKQGIAELGGVSEIHVVAVNNECKELLFILRNGELGASPKMVCANHKSSTWEIFDFLLDDEQEANANFALPKQYLYEPNASILKAGAFKSIAEKLGVDKLHPNSHLYTSEQLIANFPGRTFGIEQVMKYDKKAIAQALPSGKANITCRNFPETVQQIRKKTKLKDGGDHYLFATTDMEGNKVMLLCSKAY